ncbi:carbohydrate ABC transporter permease [Paenibacillus sinopodophylli]|uniref:carbohydrate ABC transporter permease n=1 Tax=Paenibacillus sinopodophylli TaxID=1837342 RepID=UPI00110D15FD|nr:sugar ABC transporter permease [Paenibacillus sinopodophylli]
MRINQIKKSLSNSTFLIPTLLFFFFAVMYPFFSGFNIAFTNWDGISPKGEFIGLNNFINIFHDPDIIRPIRISVEYALLNTFFINLVALILALGVTNAYRGRTIHRMIFFMPTALSSVLAIFIWNYIYGEVLPEIFGISNPIASMSTVIPAATLITVWGGCGVAMVIYIAALSSVPTEMYESAKVDGANAMHRLFKITLPLIMASFTINITINFTSSLSSTGLFLVATGGGPAGSSESMGLYIYNNLFIYNRAGYGQALAYLFLLIVVISGVVLSTIFRKREVEM